ncbi:MAG: low affinity iron permease family protein [Terriglobia bacterium]
MNEVFRKFAHTTSEAVGSSGTFILALAAIVAWGMLGPYFHYSDTWQLVINTATTIVTFLMVFLIQNTQNRDAKAIHLKLDELIRSVKGARNNLVDLEDLSDKELARLQQEFQRLREGSSDEEVLKSESGKGAKAKRVTGVRSVSNP